VFNQITYCTNSRLYFSRWSHTNFAIFQSLGREVVIGIITPILEHLNTVKSGLNRGFYDERSIDSEEFTSEDPQEESQPISERIFFEWLSTSFAIKAVQSISEISVVLILSIFRSLHFKALVGPFLFYRVLEIPGTNN